MVQPMRIKLLAALLVGLVMVPLAAMAQSRQLVIIASGWVVGVYYPIAGAMSRIAYGARDLNIRAVVESSGASVANAQLIGASFGSLGFDHTGDSHPRERALATVSKMPGFEALALLR
jgi:TRAP-type uncharacterized transport system substrate-binding protein